MERLIIVRHGIALPHGTPGMADEDRPLTPRGEQRVEQIAEGLEHLKITPQRIVASPLIRASRTASIIAKTLGRTKLLETSAQLKPEADARSLKAWLDTRLEDDLMIVGHNPSLSDLVGYLIGLEDAILPLELKKGGVASFSIRGGRPHLEWLATPRLLRNLTRRK